MGLGLVVSIFVARYLGPEKYGILKYSLSLIAFMGTFVYLGLSGIVIRDIVSRPGEQHNTLGSTFLIKMIGGVFAFTVLMVINYSTSKQNVEFWVLTVIGLSLFFRPFETIDFWFHSRTESKYSALAKSLSFFISSTVQILLVVIGASLIAFAAATFLNYFLAAVLLVIFYFYQKQSIFSWNASFSKSKELIGQSWILVISGFLAMVYLKIDQLMLRWLIGADEVGIYSVAVSLSEAWYFIPYAITLSVYPKLIEQKKADPLRYKKNLQKIFDMLFSVSVIIAVIMVCISTPLVNFIYGKTYTNSAPILMIHLWAGIFIFMRALFSKWILIEDMLIFSLLSHLAGAVINIALNYIFIPMYAGKGAAVVTLISYATASYFVLFLNKRTLEVAKMMTKSFIFPLRLVYHRKRVWN